MKLVHRITVFVSAYAMLMFAFGGAAQAQAPIKIGASVSTTGSFAALGQNQLRGYQLCVKHANDKGGVLGRKIELVTEEDKSDPATAVRIYERLITEKRVDAILGPYGSASADAVAEVSEKHRLPMIAPLASTSAIFKKGRKYVFMVLSPAETWLEGVINLAATRGFKTVAVIYEDTLFPRAAAAGAVEYAKRKGLTVVLNEAYPKGTADFTALLTKVRAANPDVLAGGTYYEDAVAITRQLKTLDVNPRMFAVTVGADLPKFHETLGKSAEFVYGATQWDPGLITLRAGGLIPVARQYPGAKEFVEDYQKMFPGADLSYHSAAGYSGCEILLESISRAGSLDKEKVREALLKLEMNTVFGPFRVDAGGFQTGHKALIIQWQDGKKAIVSPEELAADKPRTPTPEWSKRP
jgi:branched-chain amino acid transport system substrate-binding protein